MVVLFDFNDWHTVLILLHDYYAIEFKFEPFD